MNYETVVNLVYNQPWAILESVYLPLRELLAFRATGGTLLE